MSTYIEIYSEQMQEIAIDELKQLKIIIESDPGWASTEDTKKDIKAIKRVLDIYEA